MLHKIRLCDVYIYSATLLFFLLWFFAQRQVIAPNQPLMLASFLAFTTSSLTVNIVHLVSAILLLLILFGGLPILLVTCLQALWQRNKSALRFCLLGIVAPIAATFLAFWSLTSLELPSFGGSVSIGLAILIFFVGLGGSRGLLLRADQHLAPNGFIAYYTLILNALTTLFMLLGLIALLAWFLSSFGTIGSETSYLLREGIMLLVLIAVLVLSGIWLRKAARHRA